MAIAAPGRARQARVTAGLVVASLLHIGFFGFLTTSLRGERPEAVLKEPGGEDISLGLTSVSALRDAQSSIAEFAQDIQQGQSTSQQLERPGAATDPSSLLSQMDAASPSRSQAEAPPTHTAQSASAHQIAPKLADAENPWTHAALTAVDGSKSRPLWMAAQRCWRGGTSFTPSEIRIVLDGSGAVTSMTWVGGGDAAAKAQAQAVAAAINACAPYRAVVSNAGTYLVVGPLA